MYEFIQTRDNLNLKYAIRDIIQSDVFYLPAGYYEKTYMLANPLLYWNKLWLINKWIKLLNKHMFCVMFCLKFIFQLQFFHIMII